MILFSVQSINVFAMFLAHLTVHVPKSNVASMMPQPRLVTELPALEFCIQRRYTPVRESYTKSADNMMTSCLKVPHWNTATLLQCAGRTIASTEASYESPEHQLPVVRRARAWLYIGIV